MKQMITKYLCKLVKVTVFWDKQFFSCIFWTYILYTCVANAMLFQRSLKNWESKLSLWISSRCKCTLSPTRFPPNKPRVAPTQYAACGNDAGLGCETPQCLASFRLGSPFQTSPRLGLDVFSTSQSTQGKTGGNQTSSIIPCGMKRLLVKNKLIIDDITNKTYKIKYMGIFKISKLSKAKMSFYHFWWVLEPGFPVPPFAQPKKESWQEQAMLLERWLSQPQKKSVKNLRGFNPYPRSLSSKKKLRELQRFEVGKCFPKIFSRLNLWFVVPSDPQRCLSQ